MNFTALLAVIVSVGWCLNKAIEAVERAIRRYQAKKHATNQPLDAFVAAEMPWSLSSSVFFTAGAVCLIAHWFDWPLSVVLTMCIGAEILIVAEYIGERLDKLVAASGNAREAKK